MPDPLTKNESALLRVIEAATEALDSASNLLGVTSKSMVAQVDLLKKLLDQWWTCPSPFPHEPHEFLAGADADYKHCVGRVT